MISVSTPEAKQSEAFIATVALFLIFGSSVREDKASLRLPPVWRELYAELTDLRKQEADEANRTAIRSLRDIVREKKNQELEDGVLITGAFRGRVAARTTENSDESGSSKPIKSAMCIDGHQRIWADKIRTPAYQMMLVCYIHSWNRKSCLRTISNLV